MSLNCVFTSFQVTLDWVPECSTSSVSSYLTETNDSEGSIEVVWPQNFRHRLDVIIVGLITSQVDTVHQTVRLYCPCNYRELSGAQKPAILPIYILAQTNKTKPRASISLFYL